MRYVFLAAVFIVIAIFAGANAREVPGGLGLVQPRVQVSTSSDVETAEAVAVPPTGQVVAGLAPGGESDAVADWGDIVAVDYVTSTTDGEIYDTSIAQIAVFGDIEKPAFEPLRFSLGNQQLIPGFQEGIIGMKKGDSKTFEVPPEKAYQYDPAEVYWFELTRFEEWGVEPEPGLQVLLSRDGSDTQHLGTVRRINSTHVEVDFNYELAGRTLVFDVILQDLQKK